MRISTSEFYRIATASLVDQQAALSREQLKISSGREILTPSDDPVGSAQLLAYDNALEAVRQFDRNAGQAETRLGVTESALALASDNLQRVRELTIAASNDSQTNETRGAIAAEIRQRLQDLLSTANSRDANGEYVFAGNQTTIRPFRQEGTAEQGVAYDGDDGQRLISVDAARQVAINESGRRIFMAAREGNGRFVTERNSELSARPLIGNGGSVSIDAVTLSDANAYVAEPYRIEFLDTSAPPDGVANAYDVQVQRDFDGNGSFEWVTLLTDTAPADGSADAPPAYSDPTSVSEIPGLTLALSGVPNPGDRILVEAPTTGNVAISPGTVTDLNSFVDDTYTLVFDATDPDAVSFSILDSSGAVINDAQGNPASNIAYTPGEEGQTVTAIPGARFDLSGTPANGDRFTITPAGRQSVFETYSNLIATLETPVVSDVDSAEFRESIERILVDLDQAFSTVIEARADVGGRLRVLDAQETLNADRELQFDSARSRIEDLDYAEAISRLQFQITAFQAAQQSFVRIQGLSLFRLLG